MIKTELYFGRNIGENGRVADGQWQDFIERVIAGQFEGFTILDGVGYWQGESEPCKIVVILRNDNDNDSIEYIRKVYCANYDQESVLRVDTKVKASF